MSTLPAQMTWDRSWMQSRVVTTWRKHSKLRPPNIFSNSVMIHLSILSLLSFVFESTLLNKTHLNKLIQKVREFGLVTSKIFNMLYVVDVLCVYALSLKYLYAVPITKYLRAVTHLNKCCTPLQLGNYIYNNAPRVEIEL